MLVSSVMIVGEITTKHSETYVVLREFFFHDPHRLKWVLPDDTARKPKPLTIGTFPPL